ncbi:chalcone isomerase family protein [Cellvibrio sp. UBA7661]|uniref:chalcone isomerase family protein n=1 Tax=Cellvibrio sp. UBA7661 TaxID=1946311 RepID=UPI002F35BCEC
MQARLKSALGVFFIHASSVFASEPISHSVPEASIVGQGVFSYAFWDVYEATLYAPKGEWSSDQPFALSIEYFRDISGKEIADRSVQEMRKQGFSDEVALAAWNTQMKSIFPDVKEGMVLSAIYVPEKHTTFYHGNEIAGVIKNDDFGKLFFDIWLGENTSEPSLRRALLGLR